MLFTSVSQQFLDKVLTMFPKHSLNLNERLFAALLSGSLSLSPEEKQYILQSLPSLTQQQIDELIGIFYDEQAGLVEMQFQNPMMIETQFEKALVGWAKLVAGLAPQHNVHIPTRSNKNIMDLPTMVEMAPCDTVQ